MDMDQITKLLNDLKQKVEQGLDAQRLKEVIQAEVKTALEAIKKPERKGEFDLGGSKFTSGRTAKYLIHDVTPKYVRPTAWSAPVSTNPNFSPEVEELAKRNDDIVLTAMLMAKTWGMDELDTPEKVAAGVQRLKAFRLWQENFSQLAKALDTATTAEGIEFVPTGLSRDLIDRVRIQAAVAALFPEIAMPQDPFELPGRSFTRNKARVLSESTADAASKIVAVTPGTRKIQLKAVKLGVRILDSLELEEDSIIAMAPFIREEIIEGLVYGIEDAIINGDTASPHQDDDTDGGAADLAAKAWLGLRAHAQDNTLTEDLSTFNLTNLRKMRKTMGKFGADPRNLAWVVSTVGLIKLLNLTETLTLDKLGPQATVLTGQLAALDGIPIVISEEMRDDVAATGVNTAAGPNTLSNLILAHRRSWIRGVRRQPTVKTKEDIETDQMIAVITWRGDYERTQGTTEKHTVQGINFS